MLAFQRLKLACIFLYHLCQEQQNTLKWDDPISEFCCVPQFALNSHHFPEDDRLKNM